jgi:trehalose synthase
LRLLRERRRKDELVIKTPPSIRDYEPIVGKDCIDELFYLADRIQRKKIQHINSTPVGGGVAEILARMVPLMTELNLDVSWSVMKGGDDFFSVTKEFHNALHGKPQLITEQMYEIYDHYTNLNLELTPLTGNVIFVHDPQPAGLIKAKLRDDDSRYWIWRCHIDVSNPHRQVWRFLKKYVESYNAAIFSMPKFAQVLSIPQFLIAPSIDPLSKKNIELSQEEIIGVLERFQIDPELPILTQISRFDRIKDPVGVIDAYKIVSRHIDCQLVLAGGGASDDPEGAVVLDEVRAKAEGDKNIHIIELPPNSDLEINALQRASTIIIQKSLKEGFGLTVTEALWKGKPVVAGTAGGIVVQIENKITGMLVSSVEGTAYKIEYLLNNPDFAKQLGEKGAQHVLHNFLITRHVRDYLLLLIYLDHFKETMVEI